MMGCMVSIDTIESAPKHNIALTVSFQKTRSADAVLNEWSGNMKSLLGLLERIDHLITKEEMMARIQPVVSEKSKA